MSLHIIEWGKAGFVVSNGRFMTLPFDVHYQTGYPARNNRIPQSQVREPVWYVSARIVCTRTDPSYPRFVEIHDNDDVVTHKLASFTEDRVGLEGGRFPISYDVGRHRVRFVLLDREQKAVWSQLGEYFVDPG